MSTLELREQIEQYLNQVDPDFLAVVHAMLGTYVKQKQEASIVSYDVDGTPRTAKELTKLLDKEVEAGRRGEYITLEELRKKSDSWLKHTK